MENTERLSLVSSRTSAKLIKKRSTKIRVSCSKESFRGEGIFLAVLEENVRKHEDTVYVYEVIYKIRFSPLENCNWRAFFESSLQ